MIGPANLDARQAYKWNACCICDSVPTFEERGGTGVTRHDPHSRAFVSDIISRKHAGEQRIQTRLIIPYRIQLALLYKCFFGSNMNMLVLGR